MPKTWARGLNALRHSCSTPSTGIREDVPAAPHRPVSRKTYHPHPVPSRVLKCRIPCPYPAPALNGVEGNQCMVIHSRIIHGLLHHSTPAAPLLLRHSTLCRPCCIAPRRCRLLAQPYAHEPSNLPEIIQAALVRYRHRSMCMLLIQNLLLQSDDVSLQFRHRWHPDGSPH
jgi:hypothetical protein